MLRVGRSDWPAWFDGQWTVMGQARLRLADPGVLAGLGLFETLGVRRGRPLELEEHLARLQRGAERLGVPLPEHDSLREATRRLAAEHAGPDGWLKIVTTRGGSCAVFGGPLDPTEWERPAAAVLLSWRRSPSDPLAGCKTLNYAPFVLGLEQARRRQADEGLWLNTRGHLAEGCASNLFVIRGETLHTPGIREGILPGITRALVLRAARELGLVVHEGKLRLKRLETAHEAFLTSSALGLRPVVVFEGRRVGSGEPGRVTRRLQQEVERLRGLAIENGSAGAPLPSGAEVGPRS
jgi:branched-chain amino acid aminotransferase